MEKDANEYFTDEDKECLREALNDLDEREIAIIVLRFWGLNTIEDIALHLGSRWSNVDTTIERTLAKLRQTLASNPSFSRSVSAQAA